MRYLDYFDFTPIHDGDGGSNDESLKVVLLIEEKTHQTEMTV
jgi:hypothetical protein